MRRRQVAQTVSHVMLDHMSSSGVMHGDGRQRGERGAKHEIKKKDIAAVHARYHNKSSRSIVTEPEGGGPEREVRVVAIVDCVGVMVTDAILLGRLGMFASLSYADSV